MKKFMLRGNKKAICSSLPKSLEYNVWYNFVTPFDWQYFKISRNSRFIHLYEFIGDKNPVLTITKKKFLNSTLLWVKSPPTPVNLLEYFK